MRAFKYLFFSILLICGGLQSAEPAERLIQATIPAPSLATNAFDTPAEQPVIICLPPSYHTSMVYVPDLKRTS